MFGCMVIRQFIKNPVRQSAGLVLLMAVIAGCGGAPDDPFERQKVQGTVRLDGQPLAYGEIFFKGASDNNNQAPQTFLPIRAGEFSSTGENAPGVGENSVMITVFGADPTAAEAAGSEAPIKGTWSGTTKVGDKEPLLFDLKTSDLSKPG